MNDSFPRAGPEHYGRAYSPPTFRDSLDDLRGGVRGGLAEAASVAVARAVSRAAARILGDDGGIGTAPHHARPREYADDGWGDDYEDAPGGWDRDRHASDRQSQDNDTEGLPGAWRVVVAACCQALASLARAAAPSGLPRALAVAALSALALLLGGGLFACEAGLALAEAAWDIVEAMNAKNGSDDR